MKSYLKVYEYNSEATDYKGTDWSGYVLLGAKITDVLNDTLGTAEITLKGTNKKSPFLPNTKFIVEKWLADNDIETIDTTYNMVVQNDYVNQPIMSDNEYFDHKLSLIEASALAQKRIVDNFAITYKLKDVNLNGSVVINENAPAQSTLQGLQPFTKDNFNAYVSQIGSLTQIVVRAGVKYSWQFPNWISDEYTNNAWSLKKAYIDTKTNNTMKISIPMLEVSCGEKNSTNFRHLGYAGVDYKITKINITNSGQEIVSQGTIEPVESIEQEKWQDYVMSVDLSEYVNGKITQNFSTYKTVSQYGTSTDNRIVEIAIEPNCQYSIQCTLHNYTTETKTPAVYYFYRNRWRLLGIEISNNYEPLYVSDSTLYANIGITAYNSDDTTIKLFTSALPVTAYDLIDKTINCTNSRLYTGETNTFYIDDQFINELKNTQIIENQYIQKNLWEVLIESGKYIHSIPKIVFGDNNRLKITFTKLGVTDISAKESTKMSIYSSLDMGDYISSVTSYVDNIIQPKGQIEEYLTAKSNSEDYLVYNDSAVLKTNKNIIEIDYLGVIDSNGTEKDITANVFSYDIYQLLPINKNEPSNKGIAIYYNYGTNEIRGLQYKLPAISSGESDYAIKNIIGNAFGITSKPFSDILVNDYTFHIIYRTQDSARLDQTRPDLRKYFKDSKYDYMPVQYQFNNQTDKIVNAEFFGNSNYGKLIRTGNNEYEITEWIDNPQNEKKVGELYRLTEDNNNLYYVAKSTISLFGEYIEQTVTYSKDYNQLSSIIGVPSEPRFYEIANRNIIDREISLNNYLKVSTSDVFDKCKHSMMYVKKMQPNVPYTYRETEKGFEYIIDLLLSNTKYPKYAIATFKNFIGNTSSVAGNENFYSNVLVPVSTYSARNTLTMEFDMENNVSAGDKVSEKQLGLAGEKDSAYRTLSAVQYVDHYGRADLLDVAILKDLALNGEQIRILPECPYKLTDDVKMADFIDVSEKKLPSYETLYNKFTSLPYKTGVFYCTGIRYENAIIAKCYYMFSTDSVAENKFNTIYYKIVEPLDIYPIGLTNDNINTFLQSYSSPNDIDIYFIAHASTYELVKAKYTNGELAETEIKPIREIEYDDFSKEPIDDSNVVFSSVKRYDYIVGDGSGTTGMQSNYKGIVLKKDNREKISINCNLQLVTDSDRFVIGNNVWAVKDNQVKLVTLNHEIPKLINGAIKKEWIETTKDIVIVQNDNNYNLSDAEIIYGKNATGIKIKINAKMVATDINNTKAIAIVYGDNNELIIGRNVSDLNNDDKSLDWTISVEEEWKNE